MPKVENIIIDHNKTLFEEHGFNSITECFLKNDVSLHIIKNKLFMKRKLLFCFSIFILLMAVYTGCAKISAPTGGPKDKTPPVVVKSVPENGTVNFTGKRFEVTFDEYVALEKINDKFMVSPPMKRKPQVVIRGKSVVTEFEDELKDSTTYTFYFQDAIRDLNEANIYENFQFVFSTGPVLDSLSVTGHVFNSLDLEVPEKAQVLMYKELADTAVERQIPDYIAMVSEDGYFRFDNVRAGRYRLYALVDGDNSRNYNLSDEEFAFRVEPVEVTPEKSYIEVVPDTATKKPLVKKPEIPLDRKSEYKLFLYKALLKNHYLTSTGRPEKFKLVYTLSLPPGEMKFDFSIPGTGEDKYFLERSRNNDTLKVWLTDSTLFSQPQISTLVTYPSTDTLGVTGYKTDTVPVRFIAPRATRAARTKKQVLSLESNLGSGGLKPGQRVLFNAPTPLRKPDTSLIRLYEVVEKTRKKMAYEFYQDTSSAARYYMKATLVPGKKYQFIADSAAFSDIYKLSSDSTGYTFAVKDPESYSKLTLNITNFDGNRIIQLLDRSEKLLRQVMIKKPGKVEFSLLDVGTYRIRAINDINGDGKWTTGDFSGLRQPEPVTYYPTEIELRTNQYVDQDWIMGGENYKENKLLEKKNAVR